MPRLNQQANFFELPEIPSGYVLPNYFSIVIPVNRDVTNLVIDPSGESANLPNWDHTHPGPGGGVLRSSTYQFFGVYSITPDNVPSQLGQGLVYGSVTPLSLTSGVDYVFSMRFLYPIGNVEFEMVIATTGNVAVKTQSFKSTGFWQYLWIPYREVSTTSRRLIIRVVGQPVTFYVDGVQFEEVPSGGLAYPTTYIDGDQRGITPNSSPLPYYWIGTPHASTSVRSRTTRSGGRVVNLRDLGLTISAIAGLALPVPQVVGLPFGQLDGEQYTRTRKEAREFTIAGRVTGRSVVQLDQLFSSLSRELDRDAFSRDEPFVLKYQPMDELEQVTGPELDMIVTYQGGLEGNKNNLNTEIFTATFKQYLPFLVGHSGGSALSTGISVTNDNAAIRRLTDGTWDSVDTGFSGGLQRIFAIAQHSNGTVYFGGDFTSAGSSGADYAAIYTPSTDTLSVVKGATSFNGLIQTIAIGPTGLVYFGGAFTNVDGIAAADGIVSYDPTTDTFAALGTGVAAGGIVYSIEFDASGNLYAGGDFTLMGGVANTVNIAKWDGSVWTAMGTGVTAGTTVRAIKTIRTDIFAGGNFTGMGGVANTTRLARWNGTAWNAMSTGANAQVLSLQKGPDGYLYVGGAFSTLGGITINNLGKWNGVGYSTVGSSDSLNGSVYSIEFDTGGIMYVSGDITTADDVPLDDSVAIFNGGSFIPLGITLGGSGPVFKVVRIPNGTIYLGHEGGGTATASALTTVECDGTGRSYPTIILKGPSSGSSRLYHISNITTGRSIYFNYTILSGETAIMIFDPVNLSFTSDFQGDISHTILPGSSEADFFLASGSNVISVIASGTPSSMTIYWSEAFLSSSDAVGVI